MCGAWLQQARSSISGGPATLETKTRSQVAENCCVLPKKSKPRSRYVFQPPLTWQKTTDFRRALAVRVARKSTAFHSEMYQFQDDICNAILRTVPLSQPSGWYSAARRRPKPQVSEVSVAAGDSSANHCKAFRLGLLGREFLTRTQDAANRDPQHPGSEHVVERSHPSMLCGL